jgi:beta-phosphoglucomutase-like phosphatase (HAD superfamily)
VTSGPSDWVAWHLDRLGQAGGWDCIVCANHDATVAKPRPALYLKALDELGIGASEAAAIEDSPNGVAAAKAAGLFCVAAPNSVTAGLDLSAADIVVDSLADLPLSALAERLA